MIQIGGAWLHLGLMDIVVLRLTQDVSVWKACLFGSAVSDACYIASMTTDWGIQAMLSPGAWGTDEWISMGLTVPFTLAKLAFIAGVGLPAVKSGPMKRE